MQIPPHAPCTPFWNDLSGMREPHAHSAPAEAAFEFAPLPTRRAPELDAGAGSAPKCWPVVIVGAGPVGLTLAIDLARAGIEVLLLDMKSRVGTGSRALCQARRTLEIFDRIGCGAAIAERGVAWDVGRTFFRTQEVFNFDMGSHNNQQRPGMVNLQQYHVENALIAHASSLPTLDVRWHSTVLNVTRQPGHTVVRIDSPQGTYTVHAQWLVACDGARSNIRNKLGLDMEGRIFFDRFLIADVVMQAEFPPERWFWFDPPFHPGMSVALQRQADNVFRFDFQLGWDVDPQTERNPERVRARLRAMLGEKYPFEIQWISVYTFQCRRMQRFHHGRVLFAGDAAHQVAPFGARGGNSGVQDADNLGWKLRLVLQGKAPPALLNSYTLERGFAADENIHNATRSTEFITPKTSASRAFRNAVLHLSREHPFARQLVNSGRVSVPSILTASPLNTLDVDVSPTTMFVCDTVPGAPAEDAPVQVWFDPQTSAQTSELPSLPDDAQWLLAHLRGGGFYALYCVDTPTSIDAPTLAALQQLRTDSSEAIIDEHGLTGSVPIEPIVIALNALAQPRPKMPAGVLGVLEENAPNHAQNTPQNAAQAPAGNNNAPLRVLIDHAGVMRTRWDLRAGSVYLIRPDQHIAARWRHFSPERIRRATARATGHDME